MAEHEAGRETDVLVAERLGFGCVHEPEVIPAEVLAPEYAVAFKEEYGDEPPASYALSTARREQESSDYPEMWCRKCHARKMYDHAYTTQTLPHYSTKIEAAWALAEKMRETAGAWLCVEWAHGAWEAQYMGPSEMECTTLGVADTAPLAIVRAFLAATEPARPA